MNRSIHFRASEGWFKEASARAEGLKLNLSEYIRSLVSKDIEESKLKEETNMSLTKEERESIKKMIWEYDIDLDILGDDINLFDIFGNSLELLPVERSLSPEMEKEIDKMIEDRIRELKKNYKKEIWVLVNPDNEHYDEEFAMKEIQQAGKKWDVEVIPTTKTRDSGHGQERLFLVFGEFDLVVEFEIEIQGILY